MKRLIRTLALTALTVFGVAILALPAGQALAYNPLDTACKDTREAAPCSVQDQSTQIAGPNGIIVRVTRIVASVAGVAAVIMMVYYGIQLAISYGDSGKATTARNGIIAAAIGLIVIVLSQAIVTFVIRNVFN
jgi:hypothetical protein